MCVREGGNGLFCKYDSQILFLDIMRNYLAQNLSYMLATNESWEKNVKYWIFNPSLRKIDVMWNLHKKKFLGSPFLLCIYQEIFHVLFVLLIFHLLLLILLNQCEYVTLYNRKRITNSGFLCEWDFLWLYRDILFVGFEKNSLSICIPKTSWI